MAEISRTPAVAERQLVITRTFDAPRELVFKAWTERERVMFWLGPEGFECFDFEMDGRVGGAWHNHMRAPDGTIYANRGTVLEIAEPERLAFTFAWDEPDGTPGREMTVTITLEDRDGKTEMTFTQAVFESDDDRDGHSEGWNSSFNRLDAYLASERTSA